METPTQEELKIPEEAIVAPRAPHPLLLLAALGTSITAGLLIGGYLFLYAPNALPPIEPVATTTPVLSPDSPEYGEARRALPTTDTPFPPAPTTTSGTTSDTPLFIRAATVTEDTGPLNVAFTPLTAPEIEAQIAAETTASPDRAATGDAPAFNRADTPNEATIDSGDETVTFVAPITVTNTTAVGSPVNRTIEGLVRDIDSEKGVLLVGYSGEPGILVNVTPGTTYTIDGRTTTFSALTPSDIVRVDGTGYADSASMTGTAVSIIGTFEREPQGRGG